MKSWRGGLTERRRPAAALQEKLGGFGVEKEKVEEKVEEQIGKGGGRRVGRVTAGRWPVVMLPMAGLLRRHVKNRGGRSRG